MEGSVKMGYRSDVRIMTSKKGFKLLNKYVKDRISKCENKDIYNLLEDIEFNHENDNAKYFGWNNVKWYYDDVDFIMEGLQELKKKDYSFRFARIGENYDDYEEDYYDSTKEEEQDLLYPCITRYFLDDMIEQEMDRYKNIEDKEL